jgi:membrane fusion protein (multidrug efflux system)
MLDQEDRRADARSASETAQFEPGADRGGWPDVAVPRDREQRSRRNPDVAIRRSSADAPSRKGRNSRRPVISALTMVCLLLAGAGSYLYWDNSCHFETTDDAYIASRQFAIAPEVSGYITAVPVTDNEHVNAGGVIARIDDRTYRAALAQAEAQVAAANASIANIDAQIDVQQAQIAADQAQVNKAKAALVFAQEQASRHQYLAHTIAGTVQNAQAIYLAAATRPGYARQCASDT